jgi:hypothetical protein
VTLKGRALRERAALLKQSRYTERAPDGRLRLRAGWRIDRLHERAAAAGVRLGDLVSLLRDLDRAAAALTPALSRILEADPNLRRRHSEIASEADVPLPEVRAAERWLLQRAEARLRLEIRRRKTGVSE